MFLPCFILFIGYLLSKGSNTSCPCFALRSSSLSSHLPFRTSPLHSFPAAQLFCRRPSVQNTIHVDWGACSEPQLVRCCVVAGTDWNASSATSAMVWKNDFAKRCSMTFRKKLLETTKAVSVIFLLLHCRLDLLGERSFWTHLDGGMRGWICTHTHARTHAHTHTCTYAHIRTLTHLCTHTCMCAQIHTHACIHTNGGSNWQYQHQCLPYIFYSFSFVCLQTILTYFTNQLFRAWCLFIC